MKVPYMVIVGDKEKENGKISVRGRGRKNIGTLSLDKFIEMVHNDVDLKR